MGHFFFSFVIVGQDRSENPVSCASQWHGQTIYIVQRKQSIGIPGVINEGPVPVGAVA